MTSRVGVYNRYWRSQGGGERFTGMIAQVLAEQASVELICHDKVDVAALAAHLGLDLSRCSVRIVPDAGDGVLSEITSEYDLLVNGSYMSALASQASKALYVCYFPTPADHDLAPWRRYVVRAVGPLARGGGQQIIGPRYGIGWFPPEGGRLRRYAWTSGDGKVHFRPGPDFELAFDVARIGAEPAELAVTMDGVELLSTTAGSTFVGHRVRVPAATEPRTVHFRSVTFLPAPPDQRRLGAAVSRLRVVGGGWRPRERLRNRFPWLLRDPRDISHLNSYDVVVGVSQYTVDWIERLWAHPAEVLYPPIQVERFRPVSERKQEIVSAGRFFAPGGGHSKRQLEQVQTFGSVVRSGLLPGWTLHLIGGCEPSQRGYLDEVRSAATGLPVEIHANAPRELLEDLLSRAAIQWSATGFGENDVKTPWASEHFGMTTVEAMAGGCVPIVIDKAGQREIVRDGVDGYRWSTLDELRHRTLEVAGNPALRTRLAHSARERAQLYSDAAFADNVRDLVKRHDLL
jgi:glycosyltransferase involved in cell wall biosynthesis